MLANKWFVWVYPSEAPMIFEDDKTAHRMARALHGVIAQIDPRSIQNFGFITITDVEKLEANNGDSC